MRASAFLAWTLYSGVALTGCEKTPARVKTEPISAPTMRRVELRGKAQSATIEVPVGWTEETVMAGLRLRPVGHADMRSPPLIELELGAEAVPPGEWPQSRDLGGAAARYRMTRDEGGSGGESVQLSAWRSCGSGFILLRLSVQAESPPSADIEAAWSVLRSSVCKAVP